MQTVTGATGTPNLVRGFVKSATTVGNTGAADASYYEITNALGLGPSVTIRNMSSNWIHTGANSQNNDPTTQHSAIYGVTFVNPTNSDITVTQVDFTTNVDNFTPTTIQAYAPTTGWQAIAAGSRRLVRWSGSVVVPSRSGRDWIFGDTPSNNANNTTRNVTLNTSFTTSAGSFSGPPATFTALTANSNQASDAAVSFDLTNGAIAIPVINVPNKTSTAPVSLKVRVGETGNNGNGSAIASNLQLTITIPAGWSAVSAPTIAAPWSAATLSITQPTSTTTGSVVIRTSAAIPQGTTTAPNTLEITANAPLSSATNVYGFRLALSGSSAGGRSITSFNDSVVQVLGNGTEAINAEVLSTALPGPIRQVDFSTALNITDGPGGESVTVQALNTSTNSWTTIGTVTPGASNASVTQTFKADYYPLVDNSGRMKVRFVSNGTTVRTLRIDELKWVETLGYTVDNSVGSDSNAGDVARPFSTLGQAVNSVGASGAVYVEVGNSQNGSPYAANNVVAGASKDGTATCKTLIQGVAAAGVLPLVAGSDPAADVGFEVNANHVQVDGLVIRNTWVALAADPGTSRAIFSNNNITLAANGYGVLLHTTNSATASGNTIAAPASGSPFFGIYDYSTQGSVIDSNRITGIPAAEGIFIESSTAPVIRRNILTGNYMGVHIARTTGTTIVENNTIDSNFYIGAFAESTGPVTSRNNIISRNNRGWFSSAAGIVTSNYDDVWANTNAAYTNVAAGANNNAADPLFVQTSNPSLATYFRLNNGSPCIDSGTTATGLPFLGLAPDRGAVESQ